MARNLPLQQNMMYPMVGQQYPVPGMKKGFGQRAKEFFVGAPGQIQQLPLQSFPQQQLQGQTIQNVLGMLQGGAGAPKRFDFEPIAQQAKNQFYTQTVPSLAERFTALGGGQNSSAFQGALGQAGAGLQTDLAAMGSQFGQQQQQIDQNYLLNLLRFAMMPQFETQYLPATGGLLGNLGGAVGQGIGSFGSSVGGLKALKYLGLL